MLPVLEMIGEAPTINTFTSFYLPIMLAYLVCFFLAFDFTTNLYAEISGFADRQFYQDFWNATNFDEYARKWNKLVHEYLYRHFYLEYLLRYDVTVF
jgi:sterol O-acyltransferase